MSEPEDLEIVACVDATREGDKIVVSADEARSVFSPEGLACVRITPGRARELASQLIALADEIER